MNKLNSNLWIEERENQGERKEHSAACAQEPGSLGRHAPLMYTVLPQYPWGIGSRTPEDTKIVWCSSPLYKLA